MNELAQELVKFIQTASPVVWDAYMRQAVLLGMTYLVTGTIFLMLSIVCSLFIRGAKKAMDESKYNDGLAFFLVFTGTLILAAIAMFFITSGVLHLHNPEYYAIQDILMSIR